MQGLTAVLPDAKHPGKPLWKLSAKSVDAAPNGPEGYAVVLHGVAATLYDKGVATAYLTAPRAVADQTTRTITATGGVHIRSLKEHGRYGSSRLFADNVQWRPDDKNSNIIATGHVRYVNGINGLVLTGPEYVGDTSLRAIHSSGAGRMVLPRGL